MKNAGCKGCEKRRPGCHGECESFLKWRAEIAAAKEAKDKAHTVDSFRAESVEKGKKRLRKK